jgi:ABC-type phosphate transport system ATPase subunit
MTNHAHLAVQNLNVWYGARHTLKDVSFDIPRRAP